MVNEGQKPCKKMNLVKIPCRVGGGGEEEKYPRGDHDKAGWYVV